MALITREQLELLVERKLMGTITPEEQGLLNQWLNQEPQEKMIWNLSDSSEAALRERLLKRIKEDAGILNISFPAKRISVLRHYRWAAAAALFLLFAGGLGYFLNVEKKVAHVAITNKVKTIQDIAPGHSGAILTLSNGSKIILDSAGTGKIAMQGNSLLIKKNGQLFYKTNEAKHSKGGSHDEDKISFNSVVTPRGREFKIVLPDGSNVWLNAASTITYPTSFTGEQRKVSITGEVYFEIAKDRKHPFIVSVGNAEITVLGTHFNVMAYTDEKQVNTTLLEGSVKLSLKNQQVVITPGQEASFSIQSDQIRVEKADTKQAIAWVDGKLSLDNLGVEAIMRKISRWYDVDVEFKGSIPQDHYWGIIKRNVSLSDMLQVMRANGINANFKNNKVIVINH